jgi:outer membrane protein TolC
MPSHSTSSPIRIAALAFALALASCASTHGLSPQDHPTDPGQLDASRSLGAFSQADFPTTTWWTAFGDPQLDALIAEALRGTPTLDIADARLRQAIAQAGLADSARKASVGVGAQYAGLRIPETVGPAPLGGSYQGIVLLTTNIKYDPDFWGAKRAEWEAAIGEARAAHLEPQAARP